MKLHSSPHYRRGLNSRWLSWGLRGTWKFPAESQHVSQHLCAVSTEERAPSDTSHPPAALQHLRPCKRISIIYPPLNANVAYNRNCACTVERRVISFRPAQSVLHAPTVNPIHINAVVNNPRFHDAMLIYTNRSFPAIILFDSGSSGNQRSPTCYQITNNSGKTTGQWTGVV